ncbi:serine/threonine protein kinase [Nocardia tengchongensis]|uniref:non-specific serine/threonine protein kinase n=1 Tax=Nocardia tengchongensis TaxID=2055889 RepID=A0ABX8CPL9_9NOCA|nr:serine/threonine-protein kinase [Nocardia tengchongensis]QVI21881.1 serine/threonine protein kinase [Nocardia tengchongensis]
MHIGPGTIIRGYRIERVLGAGGMGTVYLAKHPELPRWDALKVLSPQYSRDAEYRARFEREANLAAALDHPNIVAIYNRGEDNEQLWIAMQYVNGIDAAAAAERDPRSITPWRALHIVTEVGRGLDHAHRRGLLHRDVKPANFLLSMGDNGEERVLLTDFGVAKSTEDTNELTQAGGFVATIAYASPEQLSGERLDHRADIYSLACSFYRLLTGQNPYPGTQPAVVMMGHLNEPQPRPTAVDPTLPAAVDDVIAIAMAKNPADRFDTCHEFTTALKSALEYGVTGLSMETVPHHRPAIAAAVREPTVSAPTKPGTRKGAWLIGGVAATVVALAAGVGVWVTQNDSSTSTSQGAMADARAQNPAFIGKSIVVMDISGKSGGYSANLDIQLKPGPQAKFFEDLGFSYNPNFLREGDEPNPRPIKAASDTQYKALTAVNSGYLLAVRSDSSAGGGGLVNLPDAITSTKASVLVLDDPTAVAAIRQWSDSSEQVLLDKLLPILRKSVK